MKDLLLGIIIGALFMQFVDQKRMQIELQHAREDAIAQAQEEAQQTVAQIRQERKRPPSWQNLDRPSALNRP